jgi:hypothetical protein
VFFLFVLGKPGDGYNAEANWPRLGEFWNGGHFKTYRYLCKATQLPFKKNSAFISIK